MPVSILTALIVWSSGLSPAPPEILGRPAFRPVERAITSIWSWPISTPDSWTYLDADTNEEEDGDGDSEGLASASTWLSPRLFASRSVSPIRRDPARVCSSCRSRILRC